MIMEKLSQRNGCAGRLQVSVLTPALAQLVQGLLIGIGEPVVAAIQASLIAVRAPGTVTDILVARDSSLDVATVRRRGAKYATTCWLHRPNQ
jgi:hypothetical protein